jgi:hypothetical protein
VSRPTPTRPTDIPAQSRPERALQVEDVVLALWLALFEYLIRRYTGDDLLPLIESLDLRVMELTWDTRWAWVAQPGLVMGALLTIALVPLAIAVGGRARRAGPTDSGVGSTASDRAGRTASRVAPPSAGRRALIVPAALIGTSLCRDVSRALVHDGAYTTPAVATLHIGMSLLPFLLLVATPRVVIGATPDWRRWLPRFALFYAAWLAGALAEW